MKKLLCGAAVAVLAVFVVGQLGAKNLAPKTIKEVMKEGHQGKPALCAQANAGKATKEEVAKLVLLYEDLAKAKPSKGDEAGWKKKTEALLAATKKLAADPTNKDAIAGYKAAVACAGCHKDHK